jgi:membrane-associated phospholipid phosphatase
MPPRLRLRSEVKRKRNPVVRVLGDLDQAALRALRTRAHGPLAEAAMRALGGAGEWAAVWVAIGAGGALADAERRRRWLAAACVGPVAVGVNYAVKVGVGRERPLIEGHPPLARAPSKLSFPSAHATSSLAAAVALGRVEPRARAGLLALAGAICVGRPYLGMHYPSDVLAGALLGSLLGRLAPGVAEAGVEERLIDLVVGRGTDGAVAESSRSNGSGAAAGEAAPA